MGFNDATGANRMAQFISIREKFTSFTNKLMTTIIDHKRFCAHACEFLNNEGLVLTRQ
jgi:hypothetical protein